jgi:hypothetical protein
VLAICRSSPRPREGFIYRLILEGCGHVLAGRTDPEKLLINVIADVETIAARKSGDQFALILDEVNQLNERDLIDLLNLHNRLEARGIRMTTVSFGQPEILDVISGLQAQKKGQLIARFFRRPEPFFACNSEEVLHEVLTHLDENTE